MSASYFFPSLCNSLPKARIQDFAEEFLFLVSDTVGPKKMRLTDDKQRSVYFSERKHVFLHTSHFTLFLEGEGSQSWTQMLTLFPWEQHFTSRMLKSMKAMSRRFDLNLPADPPSGFEKFLCFPGEHSHTHTAGKHRLPFRSYLPVPLLPPAEVDAERHCLPKLKKILPFRNMHSKSH